MSADPHADQPVYTLGPPLESARALVLLIHGRGATAEDVLRLTRHFPRDGVCYLAPQAADNEWYPERFLAPRARNEPWLKSALCRFGGLLGRARDAGIPRERMMLGGFSQGACLALETAARCGGHFGGVFALAGAVIGEPGAERPHDQELEETPVFLGCGDLDAHIPVASVEESARVLTVLGAKVDLRIYRGVGHIIVSDELERSAAMIQRVLDEE